MIPYAIAIAIVTLGGFVACVQAQNDPLPPIQSVKTAEHGVIEVNGEPFFPIMSWAQSTSRYEKLRSLGINTFMGNHNGKPPAGEMADLAKEAGGYAIAHFHTSGIDHPHLLAFHHSDEPDIMHSQSRAKITANGLIENNAAPHSRIVDGVWHKSAVIDPMAEARLTIELQQAVTATSVGVAVDPAESITAAKKIALIGDGKKLIEIEPELNKGMQKFDLPEPATFEKLEVHVLEVREGRNKWGRIGEIAAYDAQGNDLLISTPRMVPRHTPEQVMAGYKQIKQDSSDRPVFMTLTGRFLPRFARSSKVPEDFRSTAYPQYVEAADVVGFDIYPIYGWARPEWLHYVADGTAELRRMAGADKPVYAWIETHQGTKFIDYDKQKPVLPRHTRAEVWMAIIQGATGIGYFTHAWQPRFTEFAPTPQMQEELKRLNAQITRLSVAILAPPAETEVKLQLADDLPGHVKATQHDGMLYIFAQNMDMQDRAADGRIHVAGLKAGTVVTVVDEDCKIAAVAGGFDDHFGALAERIYRLDLPGE